MPNDLAALLTNTLLGPAQSVYEYLDSSSQLQFFKVSKKSQQLHAELDCWPNAINHFQRDFQRTLENQPYLKSRDLSTLRPIGATAIALITMITAAPFLFKLNSEMKPVINSLHDTTYNTSSTQHCDDLLTHSLIPYCNNDNPTLLDNCAELCDQLGTLDQQFILLLILGEAIPASILLIGIVFSLCLQPTLSNVFSAGTERFDKEALSKFPLIAEHTKNLEKKLNEKYQLSIKLFDASHTIEKTRKNITELKSLFQTTARNSFFFKPIIEPTTVNSLSIEVIDEPEQAESINHYHLEMGLV